MTLLALPRPLRRRRRERVERRRAGAVGARLRSMRRATGLSPDDLARTTGIRLDVYRRLESGDVAALTALTLDLLWCVTDALHSDPATFFEGIDGDPPPIDHASRSEEAR